ncbi:MAG TPA: DNA repair protein RecO [Candidatus Binataceae bacterium]|nr:DNA repair protein RecO [Candidatus Binataceae bacterium]
MPAEESTAAIVLRARDYSESDRIVTLLTSDFGKLSGIAKGAKASRRRFERKLEPFSYVRLYFKRRPQGQLVFITKAERGELAAPQIEDDLGKIALGSYMLELADALTTEEGEAAEAYRVLETALDALGRGAASAALRQAFELKILRATGFGLDFDLCRVCGLDIAADDGPLHFVASRGGVLCARCGGDRPEAAMPLSVANGLAIARLAQAPIEESARLAHGGRQGELAIARFLATILDRRLRSIEFLDSVISPARD